MFAAQQASRPREPVVYTIPLPASDMRGDDGRAARQKNETIRDFLAYQRVTILVSCSLY